LINPPLFLLTPQVNVRFDAHLVIPYCRGGVCEVVVKIYRTGLCAFVLPVIFWQGVPVSAPWKGF